MANQADPAAMGNPGPESAVGPAGAYGSHAVPHDSGQHGVVPQIAGHAGPYPPFHGRKVSWVAVGLVMAGFMIGGFGLMFGTGGPIWWLFWTGAGVAVLGLLVAAATNIFEDWY